MKTNIKSLIPLQLECVFTIKFNNKTMISISKIKCLIKYIIWVYIGLMAEHLHAQVPDWQNPQVIGINKLPARATSISYPDEDLALKGDMKSSLRYQSLNGQWKFKMGTRAVTSAK